MKPVCGAMILLIICTGVPSVLATGEYQFVSAWGGGTLFGDSAANSTAIAVSDDGFVYAIDRNTIKKFSGDGALIATWDHSSGGHSFLEPDGLAVDSTGNVYVGEHDASYPDRTWVTKLSPSGTPLGTPVLIENAFFKIRGVAIRPGGGLYVGKGNKGVSSQGPRIYAYTSDGTLLWTQEVYTGMENTVADIAVDPSGNVYMMDDYRNLLWKIGPDGTIITKWGQNDHTPMLGDDQFGRPEGICTDASGDIYVADTRNQRIKKLTADGAFVTKWGALGAGPGQFDNPRDVAVDRHGYVYVADAGNGRIQKFAPPAEARFTANPVTGLSPLTVQFTDASTLYPSSWHWDFGDGQTSSTQSPSHAYASAGTYTVTLTVTYPGGIIQSVTKTNLVTVNQSLHAGFTVGSRIGYAPYTAVFSDTTTGNPTSWNWTFGDGTWSVAKNPVHTYPSPGNYTVQLRVSSPYDTKTATKTDFIRVLALWNGLVRVEAEDYDYDNSDEGVGYHDTTPGNSGGAYRNDDVDIAAISLVANLGYVVTDTADGEWTRYWVTSPAPYEYDFPLSLCLSGWAAGQTITVSAVGTGDSVDVAVPDTSQASMYALANATLRLAPGANIVRLTYHGCAMNVDYFTLDPSGVMPIKQLPGVSLPPLSLKLIGKYDDVNGNGRADFADVVLYFNQMNWIAANEPASAFDYNGNGRIDFADVVWLFNNL